jgi:NADH:ubiquinone oxidoreductase subunit F (NADH-binding)
VTTVPSDVFAAPTTGPRLMAGWADNARPADLGAHLGRYGPLPGAAALIDTVHAAGLRGRGGAWFPTGRKLAAVASGRRRSVVVANGAESEPCSDKDHALLTVAPHLVLDGIVLAAKALGTDDAIMCVHRGDPVVAGVRAAIAQRAGFDSVAVRLVEVPARFVASEESALVNFLNTGEARPVDTPPRPFERGVRGRPTLVDNVETLANVALIARFGADWFRSVGTTATPGTMLITVGGAVARPGVREIPLGTTISGVLGPSGDGSVGAVLVGGFGGNWVALPSAADLRLTPEDLGAVGGSLGVGLLLALPAYACGLAETARIARYLAGESATQCGPCMFGLPAIVGDLDALTHGAPVVGRLRHRLGVVTGRGACAHPDGAVRLAASALTAFADDVRAHAAGRPCAGVGRAPVIRVPTVTGPGLGWR